MAAGGWEPLKRVAKLFSYIFIRSWLFLMSFTGAARPFQRLAAGNGGWQPFGS